MTAPKAYKRLAWEDRFNQPTLSGLRQGLEAPDNRLFDALHRQLAGLGGVRFEPKWNGPCWRWTVAYHSRLSDEPLAVVIPAPEHLQVAVHLEAAFVRTLDSRRMSRGMREGLDLAAEPFDTRWGVWSITAAAMVDTITDLVDEKLQHLAQQTG